MPSRISCKENHSTKTLSLHQAAIALSEGQSLGACKKCGSDLQYRIDMLIRTTRMRRSTASWLPGRSG